MMSCMVSGQNADVLPKEFHLLKRIRAFSAFAKKKEQPDISENLHCSRLSDS